MIRNLLCSLAARVPACGTCNQDAARGRGHEPVFSRTVHRIRTHLLELRRIGSAQMQARADHLLALPASMPDWWSMPASPPPGPPSSPSSDIDSEPVSLPPQSLVCNAAIGTARQQAAAWNVTGVELGKAPPCSVEAGQEFCSSAAAQRSVATSVTELSVPLTAQESSSMATPAVQNPRSCPKKNNHPQNPQIARHKHDKSTRNT